MAGAGSDVTTGGVAVAWTLRDPAVDGVIAGFRRPGRIDPILATVDLTLSDYDECEIDDESRADDGTNDLGSRASGRIAALRIEARRRRSMMSA